MNMFHVKLGYMDCCNRVLQASALLDARPEACERDSQAFLNDLSRFAAT
jgi:hypothetical protein